MVPYYMLAVMRRDVIPAKRNTSPLTNEVELRYKQEIKRVNNMSANEMVCVCLKEAMAASYMNKVSSVVV